MIHLEAVLSTGDPNILNADGHPIAYTHLLQAAQSYEHPLIFLKEDSEQIVSNPEMATHVPLWMNTAAQVAPGNRKMVLEDGPDKMNSDDDDALEDVKPEEEKGMYTSGMDPKQGPAKLTQAQTAYQRAAGQALKALKVPPRSQSPICGSSDDDDPTGSERIWSQTKGCMRKNKHFRGASAAVDTPKATNPRSVENAPVVKGIVPAETLPVLTKGKVIKKGAGKKAAAKPADPEATQLKTTRAASRAGGLRPGVGGSGQTDTRVASGYPSKT
jgi:hypothetical protein